MTGDTTVLIVEHDDATRSAYARALERHGYAVTAVPTGEAALARLRGHPPPSLILLDLALPDLSGWEFLAEQRRDPALARVPVVVLTAGSRPSREGAVPVVRKPAEGDRLVDVVERHAAPRPEVLVVEDEESVRTMLGVALRQYGFAVRLAGSGREAVKVYRGHRDRIALVLMDVQMPGLDGPHTLALLQEVNPEVRCCFMSGNPGDYSADDLLALGVSHLLPKPFANLAEVASLLWGLAQP